MVSGWGKVTGGGRMGRKGLRSDGMGVYKKIRDLHRPLITFNLTF